MTVTTSTINGPEISAVVPRTHRAWITLLVLAVLPACTKGTDAGDASSGGSRSAESIAKSGTIQLGGTVGGLTLGSDSNAVVFLNGPQPGPTGYSQTVVTAGGTVTLNSPSLSIAITGDFVPTLGQSFKIIDNRSTSAIRGTFADFPEGSIIYGGDQSFTVSYRGGDGNDFVLTRTRLDGGTGFGLDGFPLNPKIADNNSLTVKAVGYPAANKPNIGIELTPVGMTFPFVTPHIVNSDVLSVSYSCGRAIFSSGNGELNVGLRSGANCNAIASQLNPKVRFRAVDRTNAANPVYGPYHEFEFVSQVVATPAEPTIASGTSATIGVIGGLRPYQVTLFPTGLGVTVTPPTATAPMRINVAATGASSGTYRVRVESGTYGESSYQKFDVHAKVTNALAFNAHPAYLPTGGNHVFRATGGAAATPFTYSVIPAGEGVSINASTGALQVSSDGAAPSEYVVKAVKGALSTMTTFYVVERPYLDPAPPATMAVGQSLEMLLSGNSEPLETHLSLDVATGNRTGITLDYDNQDPVAYSRTATLSFANNPALARDYILYMTQYGEDGSVFYEKQFPIRVTAGAAATPTPTATPSTNPGSGGGSNAGSGGAVVPSGLSRMSLWH